MAGWFLMDTGAEVTIFQWERLPWGAGFLWYLKGLGGASQGREIDRVVRLGK